jgi:hypothetical protein
MSEFLTPAEFAHLRRCSLRTLDRQRAAGCGCRYVRLGTRILYRRADVERYIEAHMRDHGTQEEGALVEGTPTRIAGR